MRNIKINEAESIFEVLWNNGAPVGSQKYCCLDEWKIDTGNAGHRINDYTCSVQLEMFPGKDNCSFPFKMERECELDIREYDKIILRGTISAKIKFRMICCIDGVDTEVLYCAGTGTTTEYENWINGSCITKIRIEYENMSQNNEIIRLVFLGLANSVQRKAMLERKSPYTPDWPGCFSDTPEITPQLGLFFGAEDLEQIREKVKMPGFFESMEMMRKEAQEAMDIVPENEVDDYVYWGLPFRRVRDYEGHSNLVNAMVPLAFVGLIDQDIDKLRLACRMALAVCHCRNFCETPLSCFPGVTWHHQAFNEKCACMAVIRTLDWAGGLLTWHAKDIIYNALMMKGLPRIDSDIKTMKEIWYTNQGLDFIVGLIGGYITLSQRYPNYKVRVEEAERDFLTMCSYFVEKDGGCLEGISYWNFAMTGLIESMMMLARYHGKSLKEYVPEHIKRMSEYAFSVMSTVGAPHAYIPYSDSGTNGCVSPLAINFLARIGAGDFWCAESNRLNRVSRHTALAIILNEYHQIEGEFAPPEFNNLPITGITSLRRESEDLGRVGIYVLSGKSFMGHGHMDKGSFILEAGGKSLLIDRGVLNYHMTLDSEVVSTSEAHNMITAVRDGKHLTQNKEQFDIMKIYADSMNGDSKYSGYVLKAEYENNKFSYITDVTGCWDGAFEKNIRSIESTDPGEYVISDSLILNPEYEVCFILNTYGEISGEGTDYNITDGDMQVRIHLENWMADRVEYGPWSMDAKGKTVNRLCLYAGGRSEYELITKIQIVRI